MGSAGWSVMRWAMDDAPTVRKKDGAADTVAHAVLVALAGFADREGRARPGLPRLADRARLTERATQDALGRLVEAGLLVDSGDWNGTVVWGLQLGVERSADDAAEGEQRRARVREAARLRAQRSRERRRAGHAPAGRADAPSESVTTAPRHAAAERTSHRPDAHVTPSAPLPPQVSTAVTANELPLNCQGADAPASGDKKPSKTPKRRGKGKTRPHPIPDDWAPTDAHRERAAASGLDLDREADSFRAHAETYARQVVNWSAAFTQWLIKAPEMRPARGQHDRPGPARPMPRGTAEEWLRTEWQHARTRPIKERTGLAYVEHTPPPGLRLDEAREFVIADIRRWIEENRAEILRRLTTAA